MELPIGTVTFLFTDIEGSTKLWEQHADEMRVALVRHDALATEIVERHCGTLVRPRGEGDSLFSVFARATDAVAAAGALQSALCSDAWPAATPLRVRIAVHTGEADLRDGDYYGSAVNRCARLRAIGHGGQVLVSEATQVLVREALQEGMSLRDCGEQRLRDLARPEHVFQLAVHGLPTDFPPLNSLNAIPGNLPVQLTTFVGRKQEMVEVARLLESSRLLTLTGSGGCGKTRLSLQAAADVVGDLAEGAWLVELAALNDPGLVVQAAAAVLGVKQAPDRSVLQSLSEAIGAKRLLLILDNCEHLLEACARLADDLLRGCPNLRIVASSREALGVAGEQTYRVPPLSLPDPQQHVPVEALTQYDAVRLFIDRALLSQQAFTVTNRNAPALAHICHQLDGIPLAIELAAARVKVLTLEQIAHRLDDRFRLLTGGSRTALPRQQTLRATIDWSHNLLTEPEQRLFRRLSVFAGGCTVEAVESICSDVGTETAEVLDTLASLVDKSLVITDDSAARARYHMLESVRQYSRERLAESGDEHDVRRRHLDFYLHLVELGDPLAVGAAELGTRIADLQAEHDNLLSALEWCRLDCAMAEEELRLANALSWLWMVAGYLSEARACLEDALARSEGAPPTPTRLRALIWAGGFASDQGDTDAAVRFYTSGLNAGERLGEPQGTAVALYSLGGIDADRGDYESAWARCNQSLSIARSTGEQSLIAAALRCLGDIAEYQEDFRQAQSLYAESLEIDRAMGKTGTWTMHGLGYVAYRLGDTETARDMLGRSLVTFHQVGYAPAAVRTLERFAGLAVVERNWARAARLCGVAASWREEVGAPLPLQGQREFERDLEAVRAAMDPSAFDAEWAAGRAMSLDEAVAFALRT